MTITALAVIVLPVAAILLIGALRDGAHAADPEYDSLIGPDKPRGWLALLAGVLCLCLIAAIIGGYIEIRL